MLVEAKVDVSLHEPDWPPADNHPPDMRTRLADNGLHAGVHVLASAQVDVGQLGELGRDKELAERLGRYVVAVVQKKFLQVFQLRKALKADRGDVFRVTKTKFSQFFAPKTSRSIVEFTGL